MIEESELIISENLLSDIPVDINILQTIYEDINSFSSFKSWLLKTFNLANDTLNAFLYLQLLYNMIYTHYNKVADNKSNISLEEALLDIEGTLKKNYTQIIDTAKKQIKSNNFSKLPIDIQNKLKNISSQTPMEYWLSAKVEIMKSLKKLQIYHY